MIKRLLPFFFLVAAALGGLVTWFLFEAIGHLFLDFLLARFGPNTALLLDSLIPYVVVSIVFGYAGYVVGKHVADDSKDDSIEHKMLAEKVAMMEVENSALKEEKRGLADELNAARSDREALIQEHELLSSRPRQVREMMDRVLGIVASASLDVPTIVKRLRADNDDDLRERVLEAIGQLQREGLLVAGNLAGDLKRPTLAAQTSAGGVHHGQPEN